MKKLKQLLLIVFAITFIISCDDDEDDDVNNINNQIVFWSDFSGPPIQVTVEGNVIGTITTFSSSSTPDCGSSGNITKTYSPGTYSYSARETSSPSRTWSGSFVIVEVQECYRFALVL
jgi:hypothetical protein